MSSDDMRYELLWLIEAPSAQIFSLKQVEYNDAIAILFRRDRYTEAVSLGCAGSHHSNDR
jgi:hypothetical protein